MHSVSGGYHSSGKIDGDIFGRIKCKPCVRQSRPQKMRLLLRLGVMMILLTLSFLFGAMVSSHASNDGFDASAAQEHAESSYIVKQGDTLWAIAKAHLPEGVDIRRFVHDIRSLNGLTSANLLQGQLIVIPASAE